MNPHEIPTHLTISEKAKLSELSSIITHPNKKLTVIVEIGSYLGASACFLAKGVIGLHPAEIHCVDTWMNDAMDNVAAKDVYREFLENTMDFEDRVFPHIGLSEDIAKTFPHVIDMIFFDGDHSEEGITTDWLSWEPKLKSGCCVIFHDWSWAEGVKKVILEQVHPKVKYFDTLPNLWWGWLK